MATKPVTGDGGVVSRSGGDVGVGVSAGSRLGTGRGIAVGVGVGVGVGRAGAGPAHPANTIAKARKEMVADNTLSCAIIRL